MMVVQRLKRRLEVLGEFFSASLKMGELDLSGMG